MSDKKTQSKEDQERLDDMTRRISRIEVVLEYPHQTPKRSGRPSLRRRPA